MTIIYADGFDSIGDREDFDLRWTISNPNEPADITYGNVGRNGVGRRLTVGEDFASMTRGLFATKTVVYFGFAYRNSIFTGTSGYTDLFVLRQEGTPQVVLAHPIGSPQLGFYRMNSGSHVLLGAASTRVLRADRWYYIEGKMTVSNTLGTADLILRVNEEQWIQVDSGDSVQTDNEWAEVFALGPFGNNHGIMDFDDFYILDDNGVAPYNTFLGDVRVDTIRPDGNGNSSQFVGSDGNSTDNYLLVDEETQDGDTTYIKSSTPGDTDLTTMTSLPVTPSVIYGIQPVAVARKTDAGTRTGRHLYRTGGANYETGSFYPSDLEYLAFAEVVEENPNTVVPWIEADIDALESGVKIQT